MGIFADIFREVGIHIVFYEALVRRSGPHIAFCKALARKSYAAMVADGGTWKGSAEWRCPVSFSKNSKISEFNRIWLEISHALHPFGGGGVATRHSADPNPRDISLIGQCVTEPKITDNCSKQDQGSHGLFRRNLCEFVVCVSENKPQGLYHMFPEPIH